jgi:hypothetical protein
VPFGLFLIGQNMGSGPELTRGRLGNVAVPGGNVHGCKSVLEERNSMSVRGQFAVSVMHAQYVRC